MTSISLKNTNTSKNLPPVLQQMWQTSRFLTITLLLYIPLVALSLLMVGLVSAEIDGARIWLKPLKFSISVTFYTSTLLWMLTMLNRWPRVTKIIAFVIGANLVFDMLWVLVQSFRGVRSHFNAATALDAGLYSAVGTSITVVMLANLVVMILLLGQKLQDRPLKWALLFGLITTTVGGFSAMPMTMPTEAQMQALEAGQQVDVIGGHNVGVEDGGPGLPLLGWSTEGGDLRIAHFFGLHGLQMLPLVWFFLNRRWGHRLQQAQQSGLIILAGFAYIGVTLLLLWQALRGQSIISPDSVTIAAFGGLTATVILIGSIIVRFGNRPNPEIVHA